jgi:hypothetical protein
MRPEDYSVDSVVRLLHRRRMATFGELKEALGTQADITVFRKLRTLDYLSSYSHGGRYYALRERIRFDARGLWNCGGVHFSRWGTLMETVAAWVEQGECGWFASELAAELAVAVKEPLLKLVRQGRLAREEVSGLYLYCSANPKKRREQIRARTLPMAGGAAFSPRREPAPDSEDTLASVAFFMSLLDERQRRLFAALESLRIGRGGDGAIARATGMDPHTIAKGRQELLARDRALEGARRPGGGRTCVEKKRRRSSSNSKG